jgi:hydrogenase maturation protein HypF
MRLHYRGRASSDSTGKDSRWPAWLARAVFRTSSSGMELEFALDGVATDEAYQTGDVRSTVVDWSGLFQAVLEDVGRHTPASLIAARFHNALVGIIVAVARRVGEARVVLTGGCFQNQYLLERAVRRLREEGFEPY